MLLTSNIIIVKIYSFFFSERLKERKDFLQKIICNLEIRVRSMVCPAITGNISKM